MTGLTYGGWKSVETLLASYRQSGHLATGAEKIRFAGTEGRDVYNISAPFDVDGETVIAGRVESRDSEQSDIFFFVERDGVWEPKADAPVFALQDPFYTRIHGELIIGGVRPSRTRNWKACSVGAPSCTGATIWPGCSISSALTRPDERFADCPAARPGPSACSRAPRARRAAAAKSATPACLIWRI